MSSTRLPGKVLMDIVGETTLARVVRRMSRAKLITEVAIATTDSPADDVIVSEAERLGVRCFRGSEQDVLARYVGAAEAFAADVVVRVTSDCPLIDPEIADQVVREFLCGPADFAYNDVEHSFPRGLDVEVFSRDAFHQAARMAGRPYQREHVTPVFYEHPDTFKAAIVCSGRDFSGYRWTLDTPEDLQLIRAIYSHFSRREDFGWREIVKLLETSPDLAKTNAHIVQKSVHEVAAS